MGPTQPGAYRHIHALLAFYKGIGDQVQHTAFAWPALKQLSYPPTSKYVVFETVFLCGLDWFQMCGSLPAPVSQVLGLQVYYLWFAFHVAQRWGPLPLTAPPFLSHVGSCGLGVKRKGVSVLWLVPYVPKGHSWLILGPHKDTNSTIWQDPVLTTQSHLNLETNPCLWKGNLQIVFEHYWDIHCFFKWTKL